ncbi:MAG: hypothetical protein H6829_13205 [Planctomycetes bacterium]|nr:hypothetical protein [Planctomycetota bacterium]MCB9911962.1 hypothetical protein [Planctomycetota bacterium]HPF13266.1 hypothetical protein [Planctomycetota bacterium]HRV80473.1 hypothetical protein [Planctomycetota bacterium]
MKALKQKPAPQASRAGFSLVEILIAGCVLIIGLLALSSTSVVIHSLDQAEEARAQATNSVQDVVERIKATSSRLVEEPGGWSAALTAALSPGGSLGATFDIPGLNPWKDAPAIGSIEVITDETATDALLGVDLGMPRDLNGDGDAADTSVMGTASMLPVIVRARWNGPAGQSEVVQAFYATNM